MDTNIEYWTDIRQAQTRSRAIRHSILHAVVQKGDGMDEPLVKQEIEAGKQIRSIHLGGTHYD